MIVAISGQSGCGNTTVTGILEQKHGFKRINFTLRDLAKEKEMTLEEIVSKAASDKTIDLELDRRLLELVAKEKGDAVIGSRLAVWLDSKKVCDRLGTLQQKLPKIDLKVWLRAPIEVRAARNAIAKPGETPSFTKKRDEDDRKRYKALYGVDVLEHDFVDVVVNAAKFDAESVAAIIAAAAQRLKK
ncbi:MAG: (d)CMP kinase [Candidatus Micrarchaeota archaeon]